MPRSTFRLALVAGAGTLISSTYLLVGPVSLRKSTKIARPAQSVEDWRSFRARLLQREDTLTADLPETVSEEAWLHRSPLIEQGSVLISKLGTWSFYNPIFHKAVVLITEHEDDYSKGLILNRPTPRSETYGRLQFNVWAGGPFEGLLGCPELHGGETARQFCLHTQPLPDSDLVAPGIYATEPWAASRCIMESQAQVDDFMLFMGHCVWDRGQLQAELDQGNFWEMIATDTKALLGFLPRQQRALRRSRAGNTRAKLSRGFPLWQRFYRRVADGPDPILEGIPQDIRQRLEENQVEREADELLRFVHEELDVRTASKSPPIPPPGTDEPPWMATMRQVLVHMQNELSSLQQENCCEALRLLIVDQQSRSVATRWGAVELVLSAMKVHSGEPGVQGHCAGTLTHLAAGPQERQKIFDSKGVDLVVHSMAKHYASSLVQYKGCAVLANLATDLRAQILVDKFLGSNAIQAIVRAMEQHADEQLVQDYCIGALFNISRAPANLLDLALTGGEKVVKAALARHPDAPTVRRVGQDLAQALESARP